MSTTLSRIIELVEPGERDPIRLREGAVKGLLTSGALLHRKAGDDHPALQPERNNHHLPKGRRLPVPKQEDEPILLDHFSFPNGRIPAVSEPGRKSR
jgi:hypothetical protein